MKQFDKDKIEQAVAQLLTALNQDLTDENLAETPRRVAKYWMELLEGELYTNDEIIKMYDKQFSLPTSDNMVIVSDIPIFSHCCHHLALMFNMRAHIAYIPKDKVLGLSKVARIVDMVAKRLQLQERICEDTAYIMKSILNTDNVAVVIEGEHGCVAARGIKKVGSTTRTEVMSGDFKTNAAIADRFYNLISHK